MSNPITRIVQGILDAIAPLSPPVSQKQTTTQEEEWLPDEALSPVEESDSSETESGAAIGIDHEGHGGDAIGIDIDEDNESDAIGSFDTPSDDGAAMGDFGTDAEDNPDAMGFEASGDSGQDSGDSSDDGGDDGE